MLRTITDPKLPRAALDLILMVEVYHELDHLLRPSPRFFDLHSGTASVSLTTDDRHCHAEATLARWVLFILTGLNLFNYLDRYVLSAVLTPLQKDLGINDGQAGRLVTAFMIGYFVTSPIFGWLGDRWSRKWLISHKMSRVIATVLIK